MERFESTVQEELRRLTSEIEASVGEEIDMQHMLSDSLMNIMIVLVRSA